MFKHNLIRYYLIIFISIFATHASYAFAAITAPVSSKVCFLCVGDDLSKNSEAKSIPQNKLNLINNGCVSSSITVSNVKNNDAQWERFLNDFSDGRLVSNINYVFSGVAINLNDSDSDFIDYDAMAGSDLKNCDVSEVPIPAAGWLFASAIVGFVGLSNRRRI